MLSKKNNLIYLTGFMASGKSTIGPILANSLGFFHIDLDKEIQKKLGRDLTNIFNKDGEQFFRKIETETLKDISKTHEYVVSLGGGTIINDLNLKIIKSTGILVYLKADPESIYLRLKNKKDRPLIKSIEGTYLNDADLKKRINELMIQREKYYLKAEIIVPTNNRRVGITVDNIVHALKRFNLK